MKSVGHIAVFGNDKSFFALLKGYCYANRIEVTTFDFNEDEISKLEGLKPVLIVVPLILLNSTKKQSEIDCLKKLVTSNFVKICGLITNPTDVIAAESLGWIDVVINNPLDIIEIDVHIKKFFLLNDHLFREKRSGRERRNLETSNQGDDKFIRRRAATNQCKAEKSAFTNFRIDQREKCVLINNHKITLTPKEFELIELLATDTNHIFKADEIINHLWPESDRAAKSDLYQYMHLLRKKIEKDANNPQWILNVKGFGYKLHIPAQAEHPSWLNVNTSSGQS